MAFEDATEIVHIREARLISNPLDRPILIHMHQPYGMFNPSDLHILIEVSAHLI